MLTEAVLMAFQDGRLACLEAAVSTPENHALVGDYGSSQALSDNQFRVLEALVQPTKPEVRPQTTNVRRLLDSLFYLVRTGCQWPYLPPPAFPPWPAVYGYFRVFLAMDMWKSTHHQFLLMLYEGSGRETSPTTAIVNAQSVKTMESGGPRG